MVRRDANLEDDLHALHALEEREYWHGTGPLTAVCIATEGFRLFPRPMRHWGSFQGGWLGDGIYVTKSLRQAVVYAGDWDVRRDRRLGQQFLLLVELATGTRVLRLEDAPDPAAIQRLRRRFGEAILGRGWAKAIPANKQLRPHEAFALFAHHYRYDAYPSGQRAFGDLRRWLVRLKYHAFGDPRDWRGVVVCDPGRVQPRGVWVRRGASLTPVAPQDLARSARTQSLIFWERAGSPRTPRDQAEQAEWKRRERVLAAYCQKHGLAFQPTTTSP